MCAREDIIVSTNLLNLTPEKIKDVRARKQTLTLALRHVIIDPPKILLRKDSFSDIHVTITDSHLLTFPKTSFGVICQEDKKLQFLHFIKTGSALMWYVTCGGRSHCKDCRTVQPTFSWLGM